MRKYMILLCAVLMQTCLGATYSWSVFVAPLKEFWKMRQADAQLPFTVFYVVFPATAIVGGLLLQKLGLRRCAILGGLFFGGGWLLAGLGRIHFAYTVLGIGVAAGFGAGLAYLVPIQTCVLWFPKNKALVTGIAVAGFGGGAALVAALAGELLHAGYTPFSVFQVAGLIFIVVIPLAGSWMKRPFELNGGSTASVPVSSVITRPLFQLLYIAMITGLMAGFAVNANLKEIAASQAAVGVRAVALFAIGNAAGRILWGALFDKVPGFAITALNLLFQAVLLFLSGVMVGSSGMFLLFAALAGFNYGGVLVLYASMTAQAWGGASVGKIYGFLFSSNIIAAAAPYIAGRVYDRTGSFALPLILIGSAMVIAAIALVLFGPRVLASSSNVTVERKSGV